MPTTNVTQRVLQMHNVATSKMFTAFVVDIEDESFLATAEHCLKDLEEECPNLRTLWNGEWVNLESSIVGRDVEKDVALITMGRIRHEFLPMPASPEVIYGQDVCFVGFPSGLTSDVAVGLAGTLPLLRKGSVASLALQSEPHIMVIDAWNNGGFSGAPVIYQPNRLNFSPSSQFHVCGIVTGYPNLPTKMGIEVPDNEYTVYANSGFTLCTKIGSVIELAK